MTGWFRKKLSGLSYRLFLIAGISGLIFILAVILIIYNLNVSRAEYKSELGQETEFMTKRLVSDVGEKINMLELYYMSAMGENEISWFLNNDMDYSDYSRYKAVMDVMSTRKMFISYVDSYVIMNYNNGWVLSRKGLLKRSELFNREELDALYKYGEKNGQKRFWIYTEEKNEDRNSVVVDVNYRNKADVDGLCLVLRVPSDSVRTHGIAVVKLNLITWKQWITDVVGDRMSVVVTDKEGKIIWSTNEQYNEAASRLIAGGAEAGKSMDVVGEDSSKAIACYESCGALGWNYVVFSELDSGKGLGKASSWILISLFLLFVAALFILLAYVIYSPLRMIVKDISGNTSEEQRGNEFNIISNHLTELKDDKAELESLVSRQGTRIEEMLERRLINEGIKSEEEWEDYYESLKLKDYKCYSTMVLVLDLRNDPQSVINEDAICLDILEKIPDHLKNMLWMSPFYNSSAIVAVIGAQEENELLEKTTEFFEGAKAFSQQTTGYSLLAGVSSACHDHRHFRRAYRESVNALTKQGYEQENVEDEAQDSDCRFYIASKPSLKGATYNNNFENDIRLAIKEADRHKAYQTTDRFCEFLATVSSNDVATLYVMRYVNSIILTGMEANLNPEEAFTEGVRQNYRGLMSEIEPRQIRKYIKRCFIDPIINRLTEKMQNDSYAVMESIDELLERTKGNLLLAECADELGVHQTYIWKILKMEKGKSFTEYAEKYKIEEAKKLLLQTNMSVQEIAAALDYANAQNFIRFFSKVTGVTPGKFRKLY